MRNKFFKATTLLIVLTFLFSLNSCKQNQSVTQAKYKDLDKIAVDGQESVYVKKQQTKEMEETSDIEEAVIENINSNEDFADVGMDEPQNEPVKEKIARVKEAVKEAIAHKNTASANSPKTTLKEKFKRSKLAFKHLKTLNKIKKALKETDSKKSISLLTLLLLTLIILLLLILLEVNVVMLLVLLLLVLLIYLLLIT